MARTNWQHNDIVRETDLNAMGIEINTLKSVKQRTATVVVASHNTDQKGKDSADYIAVNNFNAHNTINTAIDSLPVGGGKVVLLEGVYTVSNTINVPSNVTLEGMGSSTVIKVKDSHNGTIEVIRSTPGATSINILNVKVDGNKNNQTGGHVMRGIRFHSNVTNSSIRGCQVMDFQLVGISVDGSRNIISDNMLINNFRALLISGYNNQIQGNYINDNTVGIEISNAGASNNIISNNICSNNINYGILQTASKQNLFVGNVCNSNGSGISIQASTSLNNQLYNNQCMDNVGTGIEVNANHSVVADNVCARNATGISITGYSNDVSNNNCIENTTTGIEIAGSSSNYNCLQGNLIRKGSANPPYGIWVQGGSRNLVTNNDLYTSGTVAFTDAGTNTVATAGNRT